jgi:predicted transposase YdaD
MPKPFDSTMRGLIELEAAAWLRFLHVDIADPSCVRVVDSDISTVSAQADKILWIDEPEPWIQHLELQAARDAELPERMHWYSTIMRRRLKVPVHSTIILLRPAADGPELTGVFEQRDRHGDVYTWFRYNVVKIWQLEVEEVLSAGLSILPLAAVANVGLEQLPSVLVAISRRLEQEASPAQAAMLWNATKVMMGLRHPKEQIEALIEGVSAMLFGINGIEESSIYQDILQKGEARGRVEGEARGRVQGLIEEARANLLRLGRRKLGQPAEHVEAELAAIGDLVRLHDLIDRILDATSWDELLSPAVA